MRLPASPLPFARRRFALVLGIGGIGLFASFALSARARQERQPPHLPLPTGRRITPTGTQTEVGSFPVNMAISPDGRWIVVTNSGFRQFLSVLDARDGRLVSQLPFNAPEGQDETRSLYVGLAWGASAPDSDSNPARFLRVSRGPENRVAIYTLDAAGKLTDTGRFMDNTTPQEIAQRQNPDAKNAKATPHCIAGLATNSDGDLVYAADNQASEATNFKSRVSIMQAGTGQILGRIETPGFPYALAAIMQGANADRKLYIACERDGVVSVADVHDPATPRVTKNIKTGDHPMALLLNRDQTRLYIANAGSDTVAILDTATDKVTRRISLRPEGGRGLPGVTPTGLALSPDESRLYVTCGDLNAVAVLNLRPVGNANGKSRDADARVAGYIPVGWYPTSVVATRDGHLFVANAKGVTPRNPNKSASGPNGERGQFVENIIEGTVSVLPASENIDLARSTLQVFQNANLFPKLTGSEANTVIGPAGLGNRVPATLPAGIKHVFYIIKENRTYDEVLGDLHQGNGDDSMVLFGRNVTPNQHALAERFVLLDNFYDCAEVSADGWNWSTSGMLSEYTARNTPFYYSGRGRGYDFEGGNNNAPVDLMGIPDVATAPGGYIWDGVAKKKLTYRNYGFFNVFSAAKNAKGETIAADNAPNKKALAGHTDVDYLRFAMDYADSEAWLRYSAPAPKQRKAYGSHNAPSRFSEWKREFDGYTRDGNLPAFTMIRLPRDHTQGTSPGYSSPRAMLADNDYAVGQIVETISRSPFWKSSAIFILEDDAQGGHDHVDAHRSICFVISPFIRRNTVDHHFYNTDSVLHTMSKLLGLPPTNRYVADAPMIAAFGPTPDNAEPFEAILPSRDIVSEVNKATAYRAKDSARLDFAREDRVPEGVLNDILWHSIKGVNTPEPPARNGLRLSAKATAKRDDDDD